MVYPLSNNHRYVDGALGKTLFYYKQWADSDIPCLSQGGYTSSHKGVLKGGLWCPEHPLTAWD